MISLAAMTQRNRDLPKKFVLVWYLVSSLRLAHRVAAFHGGKAEINRLSHCAEHLVRQRSDRRTPVLQHGLRLHPGGIHTGINNKAESWVGGMWIALADSSSCEGQNCGPQHHLHDRILLRSRCASRIHGGSDYTETTIDPKLQYLLFKYDWEYFNLGKTPTSAHTSNCCSASSYGLAPTNTTSTVFSGIDDPYDDLSNGTASYRSPELRFLDARCRDLDIRQRRHDRMELPNTSMTLQLKHRTSR